MGIYKVKGSPYYHFSFQIRGNRHRGSTFLEKKSDAETFYTNERRRVLLNEQGENTLTLLEALYRYEKEHAMFLGSYAAIQSHANHVLKHFGDDFSFHSIDQAAMEKYVAKCRVETHRKPGWKKAKVTSNATINRRIALIQGVHSKARKSWKIKVGDVDFQALKLKERISLDNTLSVKEAEKLLSHAPEHLRHFIMISLFTGLRKMNVLTLKGSQINLDDKTIKTIGKGNKPVIKLISAELERYIRTHHLHKKRSVIEYMGLPVRDIKTAWNTAFRNSGLKRIRPHDLRHTFGTWLYEQTGDQRFVQEMLNHADIKTTSRYTHTKKQLQREKLDKAVKLNIMPKLWQSKKVIKK